MRILLHLTLSGSALALLLLALRYGVLKRMPSTVYYYAWLLVLLRFVLPLPGLIPDGGTQSAAPLPAAAAVSTPSPVEFAARPVEAEGTARRPVPTQDTAELPAAAPAAESIDLRSPRLWLSVWAAGTALRLAVYVFSYALFTVRVRRSLSPATRDDRRVYASLPGRKPRLCRCAAFDTPLMFGVVHPLITLPEREYDSALLDNVLRHELMHYRRHDPLYKWFAVAVLSTQWFNPLAWLIRRELNRACELSCDELLLRGMDRAGKLSYGNTLLHMAASRTLPAGVAATTFSTEKRNLKERLEQIMHYRKSKARALAAVLALALLAGCALVFGPAAAVADGDEKRVQVSSVDELLAAIAPDTVIELQAGSYDLSTAADYGLDTHSPYYSWEGTYDGFELKLHGVDHLTLRGAGKGETVLTAVPRYANVLRFADCQDVRIERLTAGHTAEPGVCMGGVLLFEQCERAAVEDCGLYGCGTIGVQARECTQLRVQSSEIYECSSGAVSVHACRDVTVEDCDIHDHGTRAGQGEAMNLFGASNSEGFTVHRNRIHDNRAQYLLQLYFTRRALFLSNEVRGNAFASSVFDFQQYGATVDGCVFEGNDVRGGWYRGDVYPSSVNGEALEGAMLAEMTLRDIDPNDVLPPVPPSGALDLPKGGQVVVKTVDEFLEALGPERTILLDGALFDLSTASNYGGIGTDCYYWAANYDGPTLVIHDVDGLTIQAKDTASGATTLAAIPRYADVLSFRNCNNLFLGGFTAGHTEEPGACSGGVLSFQNCSEVTIEKMRLYGCGILGVQASQCASLRLLRTEIYACSQGAGVFFQTDGIRFADCDIHDVPSPAFRFTECGDKTWNGEPFTGLDGMYDVDESGALVAYAYPREEEREYHGGVEDMENPMAAEPVLRRDPDEPAAKFAAAVQQLIAADDWEALADRIAFPLQFFTDHYSFVIQDRDEYLSYVRDGYFTNEVFERQFRFRQRIADADPGEFGSCLLGNTCLDHLIAFTAFDGDIQTGTLKIRAISVKTPFWPGGTAGTGSVLVTPMPA